MISLKQFSLKPGLRLSRFRCAITLALEKVFVIRLIIFGVPFAKRARDYGEGYVANDVGKMILIHK